MIFNLFKKKPIKPIPLCEDCKWCFRQSMRCMSKKSTGIDYSTQRANGEWCENERGQFGLATTCGKEAKYFEAKE